MDMKEREIQYCNPEELIPYEKNPRDNRAALDAIELSIEEYGFTNPILVNEEKVILAGHTRREAAILAGLEKVPYIVVDGLTEAQAVNVLDLLLGSDLGTIKQPHKDMEITRLSEALGAPFVVRCEALSPDTYEEVQENAIKINGKDVDLDMNKLQMLTVIEGVKATAVDENGNRVAAGLLLKNKELLSRFKAPTPKELCRKLFLSGEVANMYNAITKLSGFSETAVKELKN